MQSHPPVHTLPLQSPCEAAGKLDMRFEESHTGLVPRPAAEAQGGPGSIQGEAGNSEILI